MKESQSRPANTPQRAIDQQSKQESQHNAERHSSEGVDERVLGDVVKAVVSKESGVIFQPHKRRLPEAGDVQPLPKEALVHRQGRGPHGKQGHKHQRRQDKQIRQKRSAFLFGGKERMIHERESDVIIVGARRIVPLQILQTIKPGAVAIRRRAAWPLRLRIERRPLPRRRAFRR